MLFMRPHAPFFCRPDAVSCYEAAGKSHAFCRRQRSYCLKKAPWRLFSNELAALDVPDIAVDDGHLHPKRPGAFLVVPALDGRGARLVPVARGILSEHLFGVLFAI